MCVCMCVCVWRATLHQPCPDVCRKVKDMGPFSASIKRMKHIKLGVKYVAPFYMAMIFESAKIELQAL